MLKPGSIQKIVVKDFVTYSYAELYPGPNLNMIIGPNGTGKSTMVAAIILGLGGSPKTVGRGSKISDYIKHGCTEATIKITLQGNRSDKCINISRKFDRSEKSKWKFEGKTVPFKEVEAGITQFNIQVDNLCQFLPQDRVQDFAKMNKQELLRQTQIAVCRSDLVEKQQNLINIRERHKELQSLLEKYNQKLQEFQDANIRMEGKIQNLQKKKKYLKLVEAVDRKSAWITYENLKKKIDEIKSDKAQALKAYDKYKESMKPIEIAIKNAKRTIIGIQETVTNKGKEAKQNETALQGKIGLCEGMKAAITKALGDLAASLREVDLREREIREAEEQLKQVDQNKTQILSQYGDDSQREEKLKMYSENLKKLSSNISKIEEKKSECESERANKNYELRAFETEVQKIESVKHQRLEWLRRVNKDAYTAVEWLRANRHLFKGMVFEPMVLELNVINSQHAIFIENVIPMRDKIAFTCVLVEDMNLLVRTLRSEKKLIINVVHSGESDPKLSTYRPAIPIHDLRKYGMFAYINTLITGPEPIMKYLCKNYHIHNIPVGTNQTNTKFDSVPREIRMFFSDKYRFSTSYSKYTGAKSTKQIEIRPRGSFSISLDTERLENIRNQLSDVQNEFKRSDEQVKTLETQIRQFRDNYNTLREKYKDIQKTKQNLQDLESRRRLICNKIQQIQQTPTNKDELEQKCDEKINQIVNKMVTHQRQIKDSYRIFCEALSKLNLDKISLAMSQKQVTYLTNKLDDIRRQSEEAARTLERIQERFVATKNELVTALTKAKKLTNGLTPDDDGFNEFRKTYNNLPDKLQELEAEKEHILSKIDCLNTADVDELKEYENRQKEIEKLQNNIKSSNFEFDGTNSNLDTLKLEWLEPLQQVISDINARFSAAFKRMGCVGEVSLSTGENEKDYSEYGLSIKVKYRDTEPLQELNGIVQSGGERAVATAAYMLSLQELTPVPFRCVDEINQGMDANNERRIFELLVEATSHLETSQYFFITPKLVPNLKFVRTMKIHIVHNGPFVPSQEEWNNVANGLEQQ